MPVSEKVQLGAKSLLGFTWSEVHIFTPEAPQLSMPTLAPPLSPEHCQIFAKLFTSRDYAVRAGIHLNGESYAVHQYETTRGVDLVYGRTGDAVSGAGACVARVKQLSGDVIHIAIVYRFPSLSANAVPKLVAFAHEYLDADAKGVEKLDNEAAIGG